MSLTTEVIDLQDHDADAGAVAYEAFVALRRDSPGARWTPAPSTSCVASSTGGSGPGPCGGWEDQVRTVTRKCSTSHCPRATSSTEASCSLERTRQRLEEARRRQPLGQERNRIARELHDSVLSTCSASA